MQIASLGALASGLTRGHLAASEERRKEEDQAFSREQREQLRGQWQREEEQRRAFAGVRRPGSYDVQSYRGMTGGQDQDDLPRATERISVTPEDFARGMAGVAQDPTQAIGFLNTAGTFGQQARLNRQQGLEDVALENYRTQVERLLNPATSGVAIQEMLKNPSFMRTLEREYNLDNIGGPAHAGVRGTFTPDGNFIAVSGGAAGAQPQLIPIQQALAKLLADERDLRLSGVSPEAAARASTLGIQRGQLGAAQTTAQAAMLNAVANNQYRQRLLNRPYVERDGSGRIIVLDPTGTQLLGTYGNPTQLRGAGGGTRQLPPQMLAELNAAAQAVDAARTPQERLAAQQKYSNLYSLAATYMGRVVRPGEVRGNFPGTADQNPALARLNAQREAVIANMGKGGNIEESRRALAEIAAEEQEINLREELAALGPDRGARVQLARNLLGQRAKQEMLVGLGFTDDEIREARRRPAAQTQPAPAAAPASAPAGIPPRAAAQPSATRQFTDQQVLQFSSEALLGPRPGVGRFGTGAQGWDAAKAELDARRQQLERASGLSR